MADTILYSGAHRVLAPEGFSGNFIGVVDNARRLFQHKTLRPTIFRTR